MSERLVNSPDMSALAGPFLAAVALLALAGAAKLRRPAGTVAALQAARLPASTGLVRALGATELVVAALTLAPVGPVGPALLAAAYAGFSGFVVRALRRSGLSSSCGCFGAEDTAVGPIHLTVTLAATVVAAVVAAEPADGLGAVVTQSAAFGLPLVGYAGLITWFGYLALTALPRLRPAAVRRNG